MAIVITSELQLKIGSRLSSNARYPEPDDTSIKPTRLWRDTAALVEGKKGPGCQLNCAYCNQTFVAVNKEGQRSAGYIEFGIDGGTSLNRKLMIGPDIVRTAEIPAIIDWLGRSPYYIPDAPIIIGNFTDPGLDWPESIGIARELKDKIGHQGAAVFITKAAISSSNVQRMVELKQDGGKPIVIVTYSGMPNAIEPMGERGRLEAMRKLHEAGIPVVMSMRPLVEGVNADEDQIRATLRKAAPFADIVTVGGLYVYEGTEEAFAAAGYPLATKYTKNKYSVAKILDPKIPERIKRIMKEEGLNTQIHEHTSCAIAQITTLVYDKPGPTLLPQWSTPNGVSFPYCEDFCKPEQVEQCRQSYGNPQVALEKAKARLRMIGYGNDIVTSDHQEGLLLVKDGLLTFAQLITLSRDCHFRVDNWPDRAGLTHRVNQALEDKLRAPKHALAGLIPAGQEWYVVVDGNKIPDFDTDLTVKWIRGLSRSRVPEVLDIRVLGHSEAEIRAKATEICEKSGVPDDIDRVTDEIRSILENHEASRRVAII